MANSQLPSGKKKIVVFVGEEFEVREPKGGFIKAVAAGLIAAAIFTGGSIAVEKGTAQEDLGTCPAQSIVPEPISK